MSAPTLANRNGIRVDSGSATGDVTTCLAISGNTSAGSGANQGIGLRKQGADAAVNVFGVVGLSPSPATAAQTVAYVSGQNPASAPGTGGFGTSGAYIVAGNNFVSCTLPF